MTKEKKVPSWGASWLLPNTYMAAWGARAIADINEGSIKEHYEKIGKHGSHYADLLPDRQDAIGDIESIHTLLNWLNEKIFPITLNYDGASKEVSEVDDGHCHARWTPNGSYGYIYIVAWLD